MTTAKLTAIIRDNVGHCHTPGEFVTIKASVTQQLGDPRKLWQCVFQSGARGALFEDEFEPPPPDA